MICSHNLETISLKLCQESIMVKPILLRMIQQTFPQWGGDKFFKNLFRIKKAPRLQNTRYFMDSFLPIEHMVDNAEIKHSIITIRFNLNIAHITYPEFDLVMPALQSFLGKCDHFGIQIKSIYLICTKVVQNQFGSNTPTAANF